MTYRLNASKTQGILTKTVTALLSGVMLTVLIGPHLRDVGLTPIFSIQAGLEVGIALLSLASLGLSLPAQDLRRRLKPVVVKLRFSLAAVALTTSVSVLVLFGAAILASNESLIPSQYLWSTGVAGLVFVALFVQSSLDFVRLLVPFALLSLTTAAWWSVLSGPNVANYPDRAEALGLVAGGYLALAMIVAGASRPTRLYVLVLNLTVLLLLTASGGRTAMLTAWLLFLSSVICLVSRPIARMSWMAVALLLNSVTLAMNWHSYPWFGGDSVTVGGIPIDTRGRVTILRDTLGSKVELGAPRLGAAESASLGVSGLDKPHNEWLRLVLDLGLLGALVAAAFLVGALLLLLLSYFGPRRSPYFFVALPALLSMALMASFDNVLSYVWVMFPSAAALAIVANRVSGGEGS